MSATPPSSSGVTRPKPIVLVPACNKRLGHHPFHVAGKKYVDAVRLAGGQPLIVPTAEPGELDALLDLADGVLLTGSVSNVHPSHFGEAVLDDELPLDPARDAWTLPLIPKALARGMPLFAICRGLQEANVALGGTLHQAVQSVPGHHDHRADDRLDVHGQYAHEAHDVAIEPGGVLEATLGPGSIRVNSLHGQGVHRLAPGLRVEARAADGLIEAFSYIGTDTVSPSGRAGFNLCVQWHPEWLAADTPASMQLLQAFGSACRAYRASRDMSFAKVCLATAPPATTPPGQDPSRRTGLQPDPMHHARQE